MSVMSEVGAGEMAAVEGGDGLALAMTAVVLGGGVAYAYRKTIPVYLARQWGTYVTPHVPAWAPSWVRHPFVGSYYSYQQ